MITTLAETTITLAGMTTSRTEARNHFAKMRNHPPGAFEHEEVASRDLGVLGTLTNFFNPDADPEP